MILWRTIAVGAVGFLALMLVWNRGDKSFVNLAAQDEPLVAAVALGIIVATWPTPWRTLGTLFGVSMFASAVVARYTTFLDYEDVLQDDYLEDD